MPCHAGPVAAQASEHELLVDARLVHEGGERVLTLWLNRFARSVPLRPKNLLSILWNGGERQCLAPELGRPADYCLLQGTHVKAPSGLQAGMSRCRHRWRLLAAQQQRPDGGRAGALLPNGSCAHGNTRKAAKFTAEFRRQRRRRRAYA